MRDFVMLDALADAAPAKTGVWLASSGIKKAFQAIFPETGIP